MTRELLILRHGKSDWDAGCDDFNRPIKDRGKRGAQRIATWLLGAGLLPDHVVSSPALRALDTALLACKAMGMGSDSLTRDPRIYLATHRELLQVLSSCPPDAHRVMLVGHNPGLEDLLDFLVDQPPPVADDGKLLPTATLARLAMPESWYALEAGCAKLRDLVRPASLPKKFPFPAPDGKELRDRPAYYHSQSAVIPFRHSADGIQILVIASRQNKHYVVPKGIQDPGTSAQASAKKEAWEKAGVEGEVAGEELGQYEYQKWGGTCTVRVYPLRVSRVVPESEWKERHRGREWVTPQEAQARLKQLALKPMVQELVSRFG